MLITIITVVYNGDKYLECAIQSVLSQSYKNIEYIIIDGGSTDGTVDIIRKYEDGLAYWVSEKDNGIYSAMNKGIMMSRGDYIGLLNSDDWYEPDAIRHLVQILNSSSTSVDIVYGDMNIVDAVTRSTRYIAANINNLPRNMTINHPTCFVKRALYMDRLFDTTFRMAADYDFILYHKMRGARFLHLNMITANMRSGGVSSNNIITVKERFLIHKKYYGAIHAYNNLLRFKCIILARALIVLLLPTALVNRLKGYK